MKRCILFACLALVSVLLAGCLAGGAGKSTAPPADWASLMLEEINSNRPAGEELEFDVDIAAVAAAHAEWLDTNATYAYQSAGAGGSTPVDRLDDAGITGIISIAETGCWTGGSVQEAFAQMNASSLLTDTTYTHVGIAAFP